MKNIYVVTNENVASFELLYNFDKSKVLSVIGSGDQFFSSYLFGASEVELYDINIQAWDYFILKYFGIILLNYEEFYEYFIVSKLNAYEYFIRLNKYLPKDVSDRLNNLYAKNRKMSNIFFRITADIKRTIPYLNPERYYQLQSILRNKELPKFYLGDFFELADELSKKKYDIILTSNIYNWTHLTYEKEDINYYKKILDKFKCPEIQALYSWKNLGMYEELFEGFDIEKVPTANKLESTYDTVISLRKR